MEQREGRKGKEMHGPEMMEQPGEAAWAVRKEWSRLAEDLVVWRRWN